VELVEVEAELVVEILTMLLVANHTKQEQLLTKKEKEALEVIKEAEREVVIEELMKEEVEEEAEEGVKFVIKNKLVLKTSLICYLELINLKNRQVLQKNLEMQTIS
jgi:hypothetical protein